MNTRISYPYEHLQKIELNRQNLDNDEVTADTSLFTGMSPTIERIASLNPRIIQKI